MKADSELLRQYVVGGCETSFHELVERYLPLVRGIVWRRARRGDLIDDISMRVFADLASKAIKLQSRKSIGGWIVLATRMKVAEIVRNEDTRRRYMKNYSDHEEALADEGQNDAEWAEALPILDDALTSLSESDREAIILRFYHGLGYREVGERLGRREDATRKRVNKALRRMESFFRRHGVALPLAALASGLGVKLIMCPAPAMGSLPPIALANKALHHSNPVTNLTTTTLLTMSSMKTSGTVLMGTAFILLSIGAGYLTGHQRGSHRKESIAHSVSQRKMAARPSPETPREAQDPHASLRKLLGDIVMVSNEVGQRPSAWPEVVQLRNRVQPHQFRSALEIAKTEYADDPSTLKTLVGYLITDWSKYDASSATEEAVEHVAGDHLEGYLTVTLGEWGSQDAQAALAWLHDHGDLLGRRALLILNGSIHGGWARHDPQKAFDAIEQLDHDEQQAVIGKLWIAMQEEVHRAPFIDRVARVADERLRIEILERAISESLHQQPWETAAAFDQLKFEDPSMRRRALDHVTGQLFSSDPEKATKWIWERAIDDDHRSEILSDWVASGWALQDRSAAESWLTNQGYAPAKWLRPEKSTTERQP